jgi:hypothetical protein
MREGRTEGGREGGREGIRPTRQAQDDMWVRGRWL